MKTIISEINKKNSNQIAIALVVVLLSVFSVKVSAQIVFDNGFEGGEGVDWSSNGPFRPVPAFVSSSTISREGNKSVHFVPSPTDNNSPRSEFTLLEEGVFNWGEEYWVGCSFRILTDFGDGYGSIFQHHGSPSTGHDLSGPSGITLTARGIGNDRRLEIWTTTLSENVNKKMKSKGGSLTGTQRVYKESFKLDKWYDFVIHFRYALDNTGFYEVWLNGEKIVNIQHAPTAYKYELYHPSVVGPKTEAEVRAAEPLYFQKIGNYHGPTRKGEILYDAFRVGKGSSVTYKDVAPAGGSTLATTEFQNNIDITISPNPTANKINIQFPETIKVERVSIYDLLGKEVFIENIETSETRFVLKPNLAKGIYIVKIASDKGQFNKKIIIK